MRILLVEDHAATRQSWTDLLSSLGFEVTASLSAQSAVEAFQSAPFQVLMVDLSLARRAGIQLIGQIRALPAGDDVMILVAAGRDETEIIEAAISAGADDYVRKPFDKALLEVRLAIAARQSRELAERKRGEEELRKRLEQVRAVYHLADAASRAHPLEDVFAEALEGLERALRTRRASILLFDEAGVMRFQAWQGISERYRSAVDGHSPWTRGERDPRPIVIDDVEAAADLLDLKATILEEGIRSMVFVPLVYHGELVGKFMIYYGAPHQTSDEELQLAQALASHVASAVGRARAEEALRASEERFRQLAENIDAVFWMSAIGQRGMLYASPSYEEIWGRRREVLYQNALDALEAVHPDDRERVANMRVRRLKGDFADLEYRIVRPDGSVRWIRGRAFPVRDERGEVYRIAGIAQDITHEKHLEDQLVQSERLSAAGILVGGIAHQLNNPLTGVLGFSQLLLRNPAVDGKVRSAVEKIHEEALRAKQIVSKLHTFSRHGRPKLERVDLNALLARAIESVSEECRGRGIRLIVELGASVPSIQADRHQLRQVFVSLFANAIHAMQGLDREPILGISSAVNERGRIEIRISDRGPGIPPELRRNVFDPFFTTKSATENVGLGLSMVLAIVQDHAGEVFVTDTDPPPGATFVIELPVAHAALDVDRTPP